MTEADSADRAGRGQAPGSPVPPGSGPVGLAAVGLGRWARVMARAYAGSPLVELRTCFTRNPERRKPSPLTSAAARTSRSGRCWPAATSTAL